MRPRSFLHLALQAALLVPLAGCPPAMDATRDGGTPCTSNAQCNPAGQTCGVVRLCVEGFCTDTTSVLACRDGGYPEGGMTLECTSYLDCNPPPACGNVISCIQYRCDPGTIIFVACPDAGADADAGDAADAADAVDVPPDIEDL